MDAIQYLYNFGAELRGLSPRPEARQVVLCYARERLEEALAVVNEEICDEHDDDDDA